MISKLIKIKKNPYLEDNHNHKISNEILKFLIIKKIRNSSNLLWNFLCIGNKKKFKKR